MSERRRGGLGRGLGALIPGARPVEESETEESASDPSNPTVAQAGAPERATEPPDRATGVEPHRPSTFEPATTNGTSAAAVDLVHTDAQLIDLAPTRLRTNPRQPRQVFDDEALDELVHSLREIGMLQPVVVRPIADAATGEPDYELVMGERRWRAAQRAGLDTIPAIVRLTDDDAMLRDALLENLHRVQLNPLEEAAAYDQLLKDFGCTQDELASRIGRSRPQVTNTIRLLRLPPSVQRRLAAGVLSAGHGRAILGLEDAAAQERLAQRVVAEGLSVRTTEELVAVGDPGSGAGPAPRRRTNRPVAPALADVAARLSERFDTRVRVDLGKRRGRIVVEFASIADLERIVATMDPREVS